MLSRIILAALTLATTGVGSLNAYFCPDIEFYIGEVVGASILDGEYSAENARHTEKHSAKMGGTKGLIGGVLGIQATYCGFYTALQGNAVYNKLSQRVRSDTNTAGVSNAEVSIKSHLQYGVDVRLGMTTWCGATPYFLGGVESGLFKMHLTNHSTTSFRGIPANRSVKKERNLLGGKVGLGVNVPLNNVWVINLEYSYTWFGNTFKKDLRDTATGISWNHNFDISQNVFLIGLNYLF